MKNTLDLLSNKHILRILKTNIKTDDASSSVVYRIQPSPASTERGSWNLGALGGVEDIQLNTKSE